jgi:hypothetical protein
MGTRKKKKRKYGRRPKQASQKRQLPVLWISLIVVILIAAAVLAAIRFRPAGQSRTSETVSEESKGRTTEASEDTTGFQNLIGRWLRPDGGYIIEIRDITNDGRMDAAYLNPRPIKVAQAGASWRNGKQQVFIELQDTGYPGSTYTLDYNPEQDVLTGIYFQAAMNQTFEVVFVRTK